jgi:hypothetical protein
MLFTCASNLPLKIDPVEIKSVTEVAQPDLGKIVATWPLTPDALIILGEYLKSSAPSMPL